MVDYSEYFGKPVTARTSTYTRPEPTSWEDEEERSAEELFRQEGARTQGDRDRAASARDTYRGEADRATRAATEEGDTNLSRFAAVNTQGYQPTQVAQWLSSMTMAPRPTLGGSGAMGMVGSREARPGSPAAGGRTALDDFNPSALMDFDPAAYGKEYAQGAYGEMAMNLKDQLQDLENVSVGAGRLRTGLFDADQGTIVNRNVADFNNKLAQAATVFSGQRAGVLTSAEQMRLDRARGLDANALAREQLAQEAATASRNAQLQSDRNALDLYQAETSRYGLGLEGAQFADTQGYQRASDLDRYAYNQATGLDAQDAARRQTGLDAALAREARYMDDYWNAQDRATNYASANLDMATGRPRAAASAAGRAGGGGTGTTSSLDPNRLLALKYGVSYVG